jgi:hypothetical protein
MEVVGVTVCLVTGVSFLKELSSIFWRKKTVNSNEEQCRFGLEMAISQFGPPSFNIF